MSVFGVYTPTLPFDGAARDTQPQTKAPITWPGSVEAGEGEKYLRQLLRRHARPLVFQPQVPIAPLRLPAEADQPGLGRIADGIAQDVLQRPRQGVEVAG